MATASSNLEPNRQPQSHAVIRGGLFLAGLGFLGMIIYAAMTISIVEQGPLIGGIIWGKVTLVDLYLGFLVTLLLLWFLEPKRLYVVIFGVIFMVMGNWLLCWYLAWRWPHLRGINQ